MAVQLPSFIIITVFILVLINLIITFPILRKFKVATPIFKPLFAWQLNRSLLWVYMVVLLCVMFATEPSTFQSIVLNFEVVLSLLMYIQGLSVIHFFGKAKRIPNAVTILLMVVGTIITPATHIIALLGVLDLGINLKRMIKMTLKVNRGGIMNRQSTKKALLIPFILMVLTSIALVVVWFIFKPLVATIAAAILVVMIIISIVLVRQALLKMDNYVDNLSGHISAGATEQLNDYLLVWSCLMLMTILNGLTSTCLNT